MMQSTSRAAKGVILVCALLMSEGGRANSVTGDPAANQVRILTTSLLQSMQAGTREPMEERYRKLAPVISQVVGLPLMTRLAIGPDWTQFPSEQQSALVTAFSRFTIANYAHNFREFAGQKFEIDEVASRGEDKLVRTRIVPLHDTPVNLLYRMRQVDGVWKIIDVYSDGISELTLRRDDFVAAIARGGAPALLAHLQRVSDDLMRSHPTSP